MRISRATKKCASASGARPRRRRGSCIRSSAAIRLRRKSTMSSTLVMPFLGGGSLADDLMRDRTITAERAAFIASQVAARSTTRIGTA